MPLKNVLPGMKVKVRIDGEDKDFKIVDPNSIDPKSGCISFNSPIAQALIGASPGETTNVSLPNGKQMNLEILSVG